MRELDFSLSFAKTSLKNKTIIHESVLPELRAKIAYIPGGVKKLLQECMTRQKAKPDPYLGSKVQERRYKNNNQKAKSKT